MNDIALPIRQLRELFKGFSPVNLLIGRDKENIKLDISPLENISLAILSDR